MSNRQILHKADGMSLFLCALRLFIALIFPKPNTRMITRDTFKGYLITIKLNPYFFTREVRISYFSTKTYNF